MHRADRGARVRRPAAHVALWAAAALLAGCARTPSTSPFVGFYKNYANCREDYAAIDAKVDAAGVRDAEFHRVPGYPYLRTDRLLATFGPTVRSVDEVSEWVRRMREYDQESRDYEYVNLGLGEFEAAELRTRFLNCGRVLANIELTEPGALDALIAKATPGDAYSHLARVLGLHALTAPLLRSRTAALHAQYEQAQLAPNTGSSVVEWRARAVEDRTLLHDPTAPLSYNVLGFPNLYGSQWRALAEIHAPVLRLLSADPAESPASPAWTPSGLDADVTHPILSHQIGYTRFGGETLIQITYTVWFKAQAQSRSAPIDGLVWRVTLDRALRPLVYDSVHPSGADHRWYPVRTLALRDAGSTESFVSPQPAPAEPVALWIEPGSHRLRKVDAAGAPGPATTLREYALRPYEALYTLPRDAGGTRNLFGPDGLMAESDGRDPIAGWSSGIRHPGTPRQSGHQAIAYVGRRHFDDPDLLDATFQPRATTDGLALSRARER